jgi:hypothetical protein
VFTSKRIKRLLSLITFALILSLCAVVIGCAPRSSASVEASLENDQTAESGVLETLLPEWSPSLDCSSCHIRQHESNADSRMLASQHQEISCAECHSDAASLKTAHKDMSATPTQDKLLRTKIDATGCVECHGTTSDLALLTADVTVLTDDNNTMVNPHEIPSTEQHDKSINCGSCHYMHQESTALEQAPLLCASCHHVNVYIGCIDCHRDSGVG